MAAPLTARQVEVLCYIAGYVADHGFPPSGRELARACGLGSPSGAHRMLVLLESKGYLIRSQGLSRGLSVATPPVTSPNELGEQGFLALLALAGWMSAARDAELIMAARTENLEAKSTLIDTARERQQQICSLRAALPGIEDSTPAFRLRHPVFVVRDGVTVVHDELLSNLLRCESWEVFVIDELVCNRVSWRVTEYVSRSRPVMRGLLWGHARLSEQALAHVQHWTHEMLDSLTDEQGFDYLSTLARNVANGLYRVAQSLDACCDGGQSLLSGGLDPDEIAVLA